VAGTDEEVSGMAYGDCPNFSVVTVQSLNLLKLVRIPVSNRSVLAAAEEVMTVAVRVVGNKSDLQNTVLVAKQGFVAISKI
jgi:hypothetical protein